MNQILLSILMLLFLISGCSVKKEDNLQTVTVANKPAIEEKITPDSSVNNVFYEKLSAQFNIKLVLTKYKINKHSYDSAIAKFFISDKRNKSISDSFVVTSMFYLNDYFLDTMNILSYSTKVNINMQISDNYFGDIIIADLNFDNKDDIAVINNCGGNAGPFYCFFIQSDTGKFNLDSYLTDSVSYFPSTINKKLHTITTFAHAGAYGLGRHIYRFDGHKKIWFQKSHVIIPFEE